MNTTAVFAATASNNNSHHLTWHHPHDKQSLSSLPFFVVFFRLPLHSTTPNRYQVWQPSFQPNTADTFNQIKVIFIIVICHSLSSRITSDKGSKYFSHFPLNDTKSPKIPILIWNRCDKYWFQHFQTGFYSQIVTKHCSWNGSSYNVAYEMVLLVLSMFWLKNRTISNAKKP